MSAKPILYQTLLSPPVRTVLLVAKHIDLELDLKKVNLLQGEHMTPEYLKMNPQHTVPTLDDNGNYLWDSHAISTYLIGKYGKSDDHPLYPKDLYTRARIDQRLQFNSGVLFPALSGAMKPFFYEGCTEFSEKAIQTVNAALDFLETFLAVDLYLVGNSLTVADLAVVTGITQLGARTPIDAEKYPKITAWVKRLETTLPYFHEINTAGIEEFKAFFAVIMERNLAAKKQ